MSPQFEVIGSWIEPYLARDMPIDGCQRSRCQPNPLLSQSSTTIWRKQLAMKWFHSITLVSLLLARHGNGFAPPLRSSIVSERTSDTRLHATRKEQVVGAAASLVAGWAMATQVAFADPFTATQRPQGTFAGCRLVCFLWQQ